MARPKPLETPVKTSISIPSSIDKLWDDIARGKHLNRTSVLVIALQDYARKEGITPRNTEAEEEEKES